jgi:hypothetical protein
MQKQVSPQTSKQVSSYLAAPSRRAGRSKKLPAAKRGVGGGIRAPVPSCGGLLLFVRPQQFGRFGLAFLLKLLTNAISIRTR